jgi:hypothetical protein
MELRFVATAAEMGVPSMRAIVTICTRLPPLPMPVSLGSLCEPLVVGQQCVLRQTGSPN